MKVACIGGGPAGLYTGISMKLRDPDHEITVVERNPAGVTFGWGVVFSDETLENLRENDPVSADQIADNFAHWDDIEVFVSGESIGRSGGHGFVGIGRKKLLDILAERATDLAFEETRAGWIWIHAYRFDEDTSTCIVECSPETWEGLGSDGLGPDESVALMEEIFEPYLDGHSLINDQHHLGKMPWVNFQRISNEHWFNDNVVLMGDAAHTAHFSIGSGTKLALEDAIGLAEKLHEYDDLQTALEDYQEERRTAVLQLQSTARNSTEWFENIPRYIKQKPMQFYYGLLTRSQRVSHENLRLRDKDWLEDMERWFAGRAYAGGRVNEAIPPMFTPFRLRDMGGI